ncbi:MULTISPECIES: sulfur carrier protein ThiS adenylyltransferase ThiF [unclassified Pseudodesulfovibrio]|uniref:sulfur carrier protein ThiS adenylyltransferase ThiF n=1 Tax=unclassified Pseudodesulfovibrio TaxID=2661612 RepID=UPI000FEBCAC0|nr:MULTISPECIES: sulfur carrier protein ThiS adenylyltransferase ThiF [unclassified Pseudodesulfovibrio]MCJ2164239.1 sulfur carrier protein ThiS adenylyltransferase ThiF [Pseudodesulfovibrio sp. S3-i]RWU05137.1 sulfur carrier protein ThiS adenylyltransferase ThiF [Pseudodesulfovibrio sp. S3]
MNRVENGMAAYLGRERLTFLQKMKVGIGGAGGLGSNCAMHLVRCGFKRFVLVDHDRVDFSNLNRQAFFEAQVGEFKVDALAENMRAVNPDLEIDLHVEKADAARMGRLFADCDAVVEAFDSPEAKKMLVETLLPTGKLVVSASGIGGCGDSDAVVSRKMRENFYVIGDGETECTLLTPPLSPKVGVVAAKQADAVLSHCLAQFENQGDK